MPQPDSPPPLAPARIHEAFGAAAPVFALAQAGGRAGAVIWIQAARERATLLPAGAARLLDPGRLTTALAPDETDLLWATEEALRSGAAGMVIALPRKPLSLTAGRRLQLAAEAGGCLGLMLIGAAEAGSNAAETRWRCAPVWDPARSTPQRWELIKNKKGTFGSWMMDWNDSAGALRVVSAAGERASAAAAAP